LVVTSRIWVAADILRIFRTPRSDFKRREADKRAKAAAPKAQQPAHDYRTCRDPDCRRCRRCDCQAYRDGYDHGAADAQALAEARNK
jgi:hypothetical protein